MFSFSLTVTVAHTTKVDACISLAGFHHTFGAYDQLVLFNDTRNLTLGDSQLINVNNTDLSAIIHFQNTTSVTVDKLVTYGCSSGYVLQFDDLISDLSGSLVQLQRSNFSNAPAGGITVGNHSLTVQDTTFDTLTTTQFAINHDNTDGATLNVSNCSFNNVVSAINLSQARLILTNSYITNSGGDYAVVVIYSGGDVGVDNTNQTVTIDNCYFLYNSAEQGVVYMLGYDKEPQQTTNIYNSVFYQNYGFSLGGAVTLSAVGTVNIQGCVFQENRARTGLGAVYAYGYETQVTSLTVRDSTFYGNNGTQEALAPTESAALTDTAECGGLYASYCQCVATSGSFFENNIGTGMCVHGHGSTAGSCIKDGSDFFNVSTIVDADGTAFFQTFMGRYNDIDMGLDIRDSSFINNSAAFVTRNAPESETEPIDFLTGGAALNVLDVQFSFMSNSIFQNNIGRQGSGANLDTCFFSVFWNNTFDNNTATQQGAAIALVNSHNLGVMVANSTLTNGQAVTGGAMYGDAGATITISNGSQLTHNQAVTDGGGVYCDSCQALLLQLNSNISANHAGESGGAAYCTSCVTLTATGVSMSNNRCESSHCCICLFGLFQVLMMTTASLVEPACEARPLKLDTCVSLHSTISLRCYSIKQLPHFCSQ